MNSERKAYHKEKPIKIEVVDFYLNKNPKSKVFGTLHVYLPDLDLDLRGLPVFKVKKGYLIKTMLIATKDETGKPVRYPVFNFCNPDKHKNFLNSLYEAGQKFMQEWGKK